MTLSVCDTHAEASYEDTSGYTKLSFETMWKNCCPLGENRKGATNGTQRKHLKFSVVDTHIFHMASTRAYKQ